MAGGNWLREKQVLQILGQLDSEQLTKAKLVCQLFCVCCGRTKSKQRLIVLLLSERVCFAYTVIGELITIGVRANGSEERQIERLSVKLS